MSRDVTAVITTHVRPQCVDDALESVRAETYAHVEVVVVDDGGQFVSPVRGVRVVHGGTLGVARARNLGLEAARGEFVIFLDDDDVVLPHRIATLVSAAQRFDATLCYALTRRVAAEPLENVPTHLLQPGRVGFCDLLACAPHIDSVLVRTEALRAVGGFDVETDHLDDWAAWLRLADRNAPMAFVRDVVAEWRIREDGLSAEVLSLGVMKARLISLFERLKSAVSEENGRAVAIAQEVVMANEITTYDDYADAIARTRKLAACSS